MNKGLIFFCCSCAILLFSIINLSIGPIINGKVNSNYISIMYDTETINTYGFDWGTLNCAKLSDYYDEFKKAYSEMTDKEKKYIWEWKINECNRKKAMHDMEYTSFIFDVVIGFICSLLGLLHYLDIKKEFVSKTGLIGCGCGIIGFIFTFVYLIFNGIVYTNYYDTSIYKTDSNGAIAELKGGKYECFYYDDDQLNVYSHYAKYSDLIKKQYNYNKDLEEDLAEMGGKCRLNPSSCMQSEYYEPASIPKDKNGNDCKFLYLGYVQSTDITNKDKSDRFLTVLILSLFVCLANLALALFGFLLFRTPGDF